MRLPQDARRLNAGVADRNVDAVASDGAAALDDVALDDVLTLEGGVFEANVQIARPDDLPAERVLAWLVRTDSVCRSALTDLWNTASVYR